MLSFVWFVTCVLMWLGPAFIVVEVNAGSRILCARRSIVDEDQSPSTEVRYRQRLIQDGFYYDYDDDEQPSGREIPDEDFDADDDEKRSSEWRKVRRYIKRQLKVPKRYLKKIVRAVGVATTFRAYDGDDGVVSWGPSEETNSLLARSNGRLNGNRIIVSDEPESVKYYTVIRQ